MSIYCIIIIDQPEVTAGSGGMRLTGAYRSMGGWKRPPHFIGGDDYLCKKYYK